MYFCVVVGLANSLFSSSTKSNSSLVCYCEWHHLTSSLSHLKDVFHCHTIDDDDDENERRKTLYKWEVESKKEIAGQEKKKTHDYSNSFVRNSLRGVSWADMKINSLINFFVKQIHSNSQNSISTSRINKRKKNMKHEKKTEIKMRRQSIWNWFEI